MSVGSGGSRRPWLTAMLVLGVSIAGLWPFGPGLLRGEVPGQRELPIDGGHGLYIYALVGEALSGHGSVLHTDSMWFPTGRPFLLVVQNIVDAGLAQPFLAAFSPQTALAIFAALVLISNGLAGGWLGVQIAGRGGALAGALVMAMSPYTWGEEQTGRIAQTMLAPMAMAVGYAWQAVETGRGGWKAGLWLGIAGLGYWFYGAFGAVVVAGCLLGAAADASRRRAALVELGKAAGIALAMAAPFMLFSALSWEDMAGTAVKADPIPNATRLLGGWFWLPHPRIVAYLPQALFAVGALACIRAPRGRSVGLAIATLLLCWTALGESVRIAGVEVPTPLWVLRQLPGFSRFWWPHRALAGAQVALAALAAIAFAHGGWRRWAVGGGLALVVAQGLGVPGPLTTWRVPPKPAWADEIPAGAMLFLPMLDPEVGKTRFAEWVWYRRPLVNGMSMWDEYLWPDSWRQWAKGQPLVDVLLRIEQTRPHGRKKPNPGGFSPEGGADAAAVVVPTLAPGAVSALAAEGVGVIVAEVQRTPPASLKLLEGAIGPATCDAAGRACWWAIQ